MADPVSRDRRPDWKLIDTAYHVVERTQVTTKAIYCSIKGSHLESAPLALVFMESIDTKPTGRLRLGR